MYLGFFITIHQDTPGYKIKITCILNASHDDTSGYNQDTSRYMYLGRFVRAALDTHKIRSRSHSRYIKDTYLGSKDGNHYRILEHTTGYIYQQGFPPSATEEPDEEDPEVDDKTGGDDGDQGGCGLARFGCGLVGGWVGFEGVRFVRFVCLSRVSRLPPVSFYR